jgi:hypothetical protein
MESSQDYDELHPIIEKTLFELEVCAYRYSAYEDFLESAIRTRKKWEFSGDESEWNQKYQDIKEQVSDAKIDELRKVVAEYGEELEGLEILKQLYMEVFN